ncbi:DUF1612 domain-containing protein [Sinorhizobium meliloti]|uniref:DUF1612 domain-containing protein n=1 Tax=Rhizobium meliloti TaxID=382 RepID=UPI003A7F4432
MQHLPSEEGRGACLRANRQSVRRRIGVIDALLARSEVVIAEARRTGPAKSARAEEDLLVYDRDWDEDVRLDERRVVLTETEGLPPVLRAALLLDA